MQADITEGKVLDVSKEVIALVRKHTSDISTGRAILSAASAALGGGFSRSAQDRMADYLSPSEPVESLRESSVGV
jgi:hypothetical protein